MASKNNFLYDALKRPIGGMVGLTQGIGNIFKSEKRKQKEVDNPRSTRNTINETFPKSALGLGKLGSTMAVGEGLGVGLGGVAEGIGGAAKGLISKGGQLIQDSKVINKVKPVIDKGSNLIKEGKTVIGNVINEIPGSEKIISGTKKVSNVIGKAGAVGIKGGINSAITAGLDPSEITSNVSSDAQRRLEIINGEKGQGNSPATNPVTATQQEEMKVAGQKQQKDTSKQMNRDVQESGGVDHSPQYNPNTKKDVTSNNANISPITKNNNITTTNSIQPNNTQQVNNVQQPIGNAQQPTGNIDKIIQSNIAEIQTAYHNDVYNGMTMEEADKNFYDRFKTLNSNLTKLGHDPVELPAPIIGETETKYNDYNNIPTVEPSPKENYNGISLIRQTSTTPTTDVEKQLENSSSMLYDPSTGTYKVKTLVETHKGDTYGAEDLKSQFSSNKVPNSGAGMGKNFGTSLDDLNLFLNAFKPYANRFPQGNKLLQNAQAAVQDAINANDVPRYQDALAKLKMTASDVANAINSDLYKTFGGDQISLNGVPIYNQLRGIINGGYKVQEYYNKGYSDILKEVNQIGQSKLGVEYVGLDSYSAKRKSMLVNNSTYKDMINRYATDDTIKKQLLADMYKPEITSNEKSFLKYLSNNVQSQLTEAYHNLKEQYGSTKAKQMLPLYQELYDLTGIPYRKTFDDYLDSMKEGLTKGSTFGNTTTQVDQPQYNIPEVNTGEAVQRVIADNSTNYLNVVPSFKGIA